jgi:hypothetical protein
MLIGRPGADLSATAAMQRLVPTLGFDLGEAGRRDRRAGDARPRPLAMKSSANHYQIAAVRFCCNGPSATGTARKLTTRSTWSKNRLSQSSQRGRLLGVPGRPCLRVRSKN